MIVKDSGRSFADCDAKGTGWVAMGFDGTLRTEGLKPTREWRLHRFLLQNLPGAGAVVHTHSPWSIAWADSHGEIPCVTHHFELKVKHPVPVLDIPAGVVPEENMPDILALFRAQPELQAFMLRGHGIVAIGKDAVSAEHLAELIEETSQIAVLQSLMKR